MTTYNLVPGINLEVLQAGVPVLVIPPNTFGGGRIFNSGQAADQDTDSPEVLYVSQVTSDFANASNDTVFTIAPNTHAAFPGFSSLGVWVTAATAGHKFSAWYEVVATNFPPSPVPGNFPPSNYTTMLNVIPSFLYQEYTDDDDLQAYVASYNTIGQNFIDTINSLNLPIYTGDNISGLLLDWVGAGIYGIPRPNLSSFDLLLYGPFNTYQFNFIEYNQSELLGPENIVATSDDTYKRILTWALLKGDGKIIGIRWLKRRIMRFLIGTNGTNPDIDQTYQISITFGPNNEVAIKFIDEITTPIFGAQFNGFQYNTAQYDELEVDIVQLIPLPYRQIFKEAADTGAIELPFQFTWNVIL